MHANHCLLLIGAEEWHYNLLENKARKQAKQLLFFNQTDGVCRHSFFSSRKSEPLSCRGFDGYLVFIYAHN